jgi:hypothetical protein
VEEEAKKMDDPLKDKERPKYFVNGLWLCGV